MLVVLSSTTIVQSVVGIQLYDILPLVCDYLRDEQTQKYQHAFALVAVRVARRFSIRMHMHHITPRTLLP